MRLLPRTVVFPAVVILPLTAMAETPAAPPPQPQQAPDPAESVHVQPRGDAFMPKSAEEDAVQRRIKIFNETLESMDASLDRKLRICRGC